MTSIINKIYFRRDIQKYLFEASIFRYSEAKQNALFRKTSQAIFCRTKVLKTAPPSNLKPSIIWIIPESGICFPRAKHIISIFFHQGTRSIFANKTDCADSSNRCEFHAENRLRRLIESMRIPFGIDQKYFGHLLEKGILFYNETRQFCLSIYESITKIQKSGLHY